MDFAFTPEQEELRELAAKVLGDHATHERLKRIEAEPEGIDRAAWDALARTSLLGTAIAEEHGGRVNAINNPDRGATFKVELPVAKS